MNTSPFTGWVWKYIWVLNDSRYKLSDLPHIALESEAMTADPLNTDKKFYIDQVIVMDEGNIFVHMENPTLH